MLKINIGSNIKKCRNKYGITQRELAEKLYVATKTIQNYEQNRKEPNLSLVVEMAEILDVTLDELIIGNKLNNESEEIINENAIRI